METLTTTKIVLDKIKARAIARWGDKKWLAELVREYCRIAEKPSTDPRSRYPQIKRAFDNGGCTLDTAIALAAAVGCKFQLACTHVEVEEL